MTRDPEIQALLDKQAIADVLQRYARTLDWLDDDGQARCFWPDAAIDYGFFSGSAADFLPVVMAIERGSVRRWHMLSAPAIRFDGADAAEVETYGVFAGAREQDDGTLAGSLIGGRYHDRFERRGGEWRIARRTFIHDWQTPLVKQPGFDPDPTFPLTTVKIDRSDHPMYRAM